MFRGRRPYQNGTGLALLCALFLQPLALGQSKKTSLPSVTVSPWHRLGIVHELWQRSQPALRNAQQSILDRMVRKPVRLTSSNQEAPPLHNLKFQLRDYWRETAENSVPMLQPLKSTPILIEPIWGALADHYLLFLPITIVTQDRLQAVAHLSIPRETWEYSLLKYEFYEAARQAEIEVEEDPWPDYEELPILVNKNVNDLIDRLENNLQKVSQAGSHKTNHIVKITTNSATPLTRADEASDLCLNLLVGEKLASTGIFVRTLNYEGTAMLQRWFKQTLPVFRAARVLTTRWTLPKKTPRKLPLTLEFSGTWTEGVLATQLRNTFAGPVTFAINSADQTVNFRVPQSLYEFVKDQNEHLAPDNLPKAAATDRSWVYLDKGRAWGLEISDRLVAAKGKIKGHVVAFYGADKGILDLSKKPIPEGAIVYIRKGQRLVKRGETFSFDLKQYPTPWPP